MFERIRASAAGESGFSIVEVVASALILAVLAGAVALALIGNVKFSGNERQRSQADEVAQQDQERLRGLSAQELNDVNGQTRTVQLDNTPYTVTSTAQFLSSGGVTACGSTGSGAAAYFKVVSSVIWNGNKTPVVEQSVIAPPGGGVLLTQVEDQTGAGVSGVGVSASGPSAASGTTDSTGCTVLAGLASGSYTLTLSKSGYVDTNGNSSPLSTTSTVTSTGTATPSGGNPVLMAQPGTIAAKFSANGASGQEADAFSWIGTGATNSMSSPNTYDPSTTPYAQLPTSGSENLFPFAFSGPSYTNNYQVWAGKCLQNQPPTGQNMFSVAPASSQTLTVPEPAIALTVTYAGTRVAPGHVKFAFQSATGTSCTDSWYASVNPSAGLPGQNALLYPGQPFASAATSGSTESASGYTGSYTICGDYTTGGTTRKATATTTNTSFSSATAVSIPITSTSTTGTC